MEFSDTEEREKLLVELADMKDSSECYELIRQYYPGWMLGFFDQYSSDYPSLTTNWKTICTRLKVVPQKILIASSLSFDDNHKIQQKVCDFLMKYGYVIRREGEFIGCSVCGLAIPCIELWGNLKHRGIPCPEVWNTKCTGC